MPSDYPRNMKKLVWRRAASSVGWAPLCVSLNFLDFLQQARISFVIRKKRKHACNIRVRAVRLIWCVNLRVFLDETNSYISELSQADCPPWCAGSHEPAEGLARTKRPVSRIKAEVSRRWPSDFIRWPTLQMLDLPASPNHISQFLIINLIHKFLM